MGGCVFFADMIRKYLIYPGGIDAAEAAATDCLCPPENGAGTPGNFVLNPWLSYTPVTSRLLPI